MRPTPQEVIDGVRALLRDVVGPAVSDQHAVAMLRRAMVALRDVDWNEAPFDLLRETQALAAMAQHAEAWLQDHPDTANLSLALATARAKATQLTSFAACEASNRALRQALADFITLAGSVGGGTDVRDAVVREMVRLANIKAARP